MKCALLVVLVIFTFGQDALAQSAYDTIKETTLSLRLATNESFKMEVFDYRRKNRTVKTSFAGTLNLGVYDQIMLKSDKGDELTLVATGDGFQSPATFLRRSGEMEMISTANPAQTLPNVGLQFADIYDYIGSRKLLFGDYAYKDDPFPVEGCSWITSLSRIYVYYEIKDIKICDGVIKEVIITKGGMVIKRIEYSQVEKRDGWWRPTEILIFEAFESEPILRITIQHGG